MLLALEHQETDRVPIALGFGVNAPVLRTLQRYLGLTSVTEVHDWLLAYSDIRTVSPRFVGLRLPSSAKENSDIWGVRRQEVSYGDGSYREISYYPLHDARDISDLNRHRWPEADWFDFASIGSRIDCIQRSGPFAIRSGLGNIFETAWYMRGFEQMLADLVLQPELAYEIMRRVTDFYVAYNTRLLQAAAGRIDIIFTADDIAGQRGLLMSLPMWEQHIKPHHERLNRAIKQFDVRIMYHSDGAVTEAVPELIDMGVDVLEALQFSADDMDPEFLKAAYGDRLCFHGGICVQKTLPFGSVEAVRCEVLERIRVLGKGGGYILAPSHAIQAGTPPENVVALFETAVHG